MSTLEEISYSRYVTVAACCDHDRFSTIGVYGIEDTNMSDRLVGRAKSIVSRFCFCNSDIVAALPTHGYQEEQYNVKQDTSEKKDKRRELDSNQRPPDRRERDLGT